jgi:alginate O-acetyltransferase complex protein AlgI
MLFCSQQFLLFFLVVFVTYWAIPWQRVRVWLLLAASFYFYASWNHWLACLICVTSVADYLFARGMESPRFERWRRVLLIASISMNLGLLAYFKYANFFLQSLQEALQAVGTSTSFPVLSIFLPLGISFYTFEAISYTVDVYKRLIPAEKNLSHFMLFILFFPHLIAGPIVRARDFLPQIGRAKRWDWARLNLGVQFFLLGVFKKLAIADRMAIYADPIFADPEQYRTGAIWIGVLAYAIQIYCDFSGYSDMALGTAHLLGYKLSRNFNMPYFAPNISEFWRRWHMSLSGWLRDYLYIPLGGSRGGRWQTVRNLLITMTLCGLWHGAAWSFILWGFLHALLLIGQRGFASTCESLPVLNAWLKSRLGTTLRIATTFLVCTCLWVPFRAPTFDAMLLVWQRMLTPEPGLCEPIAFSCFATLLLIVILCHMLGSSAAWNKLLQRTPGFLMGWGYAIMLTLALILAPATGKTFVYFQF